MNCAQQYQWNQDKTRQLLSSFLTASRKAAFEELNFCNPKINPALILSTGLHPLPSSITRTNATEAPTVTPAIAGAATAPTEE